MIAVEMNFLTFFLPFFLTLSYIVLSVQSSGNALVGQPYTLSCIVAESDIGDVTELTWTDAMSGDVLNTSSQSQLELVFEVLELSDVGNYTCSVSYSNGDSRQLTEQVVAEGKF